MAADLELEPYENKLYTNGARYVDTERFAPRTPFEERNKVVGFLGRLEEEKGIRTLATVAKQLSPEVTFRFLGDGELREWLEDELADERSRGTVELAGWVDHEDVPEELNRLRLLVMPSATEGLPTAILESMACGTPAYATPVSGVPDIVREDETGFLMDEVDGVAIADNIEEILDREDLDEISASARMLIEREYSFEAAVERYEEILRTAW